MRYPVAIEFGTEHTAFGVAVPDLPGCFSAGDTLNEALSNAEEAVAAWIDAVLDAGGAVPRPTDIQRIQLLPDFEGWAFGFIEVEPERSMQRSDPEPQEARSANGLLRCARNDDTG